MKGNPKGVNKGLDCDVIVAEVRSVQVTLKCIRVYLTKSSEKLS